ELGPLGAGYLGTGSLGTVFFGTGRPRAGVEPGAPPGNGNFARPGCRRAFHAARLVGRVTLADVRLHQGPGPVAVAGRLRVAREPLADPALRDERARRLHGAARQRQPPP